VQHICHVARVDDEIEHGIDYVRGQML
jgi:hypothetical protein